MKMEVYSVYDLKAAAYSPPFYVQNDAVAIRAFTDIANDRRSSVSKYPGDYELRHIGTFDDGTADYKKCDPKTLTTGASVQVQPQLGFDPAAVPAISKKEEKNVETKKRPVGNSKTDSAVSSKSG